MRAALSLCTSRNFTVTELSIEHAETERPADIVTVWLSVRGNEDATGLAAALADLDGMVSFAHDDPDAAG